MIVKYDKADIEHYIGDTSNIPGNASLVYLPETVAELSTILSDCASNGIAVTFSAGGTGTTGGRVPLDGVIVSMEKFNSILELDIDKKQVYIQAGIPLLDVEKMLNDKKLSLRTQPTEPLAFVGGVVSTCASGPKSFKYNSIREYVIYLKVVLSDGAVLEINRGQIISKGRSFKFELAGKKYAFELPSYQMPKVKHSGGYYVQDDMDLIDLFIGQEGTLGCVVEVGLQVQDMAFGFADMMLFFHNDKDAFSFVNELKQFKNKKDYLMPTSVEFFDSNSLDFLKNDYPELVPGMSAIYIEQELHSKEDRDLVIDRYSDLALRFKAPLELSWFADNERNRMRLKEFRHTLPQRINEFLRLNKTRKKATDIAVSDEQFPVMYKFYRSIGEESGMRWVNFGHIGQNHLHFNFLPYNKEQESTINEYVERLIRRAVELGGTVSAEHGIGKIKKDYLEILYGSESIKEMAELKKYFDPAMILNLDNVFSKDFL